MKRVVLIISLLCLAFLTVGCSSKIEPIDESQLATYLKGQDKFLADNYLDGKYSLIDSNDELMHVDYKGENSLLVYEASYTVKSEIKDKKWTITSFTIDNKEIKQKDVTNLIYELVEKTDEKISSGKVSGKFTMLESKMVDNKLAFSMTFTSNDDSYDVYFEGYAKDSLGSLVIEQLVSKVASSEEETKYNDNNDLEKAISKFYTDQGYVVESISNFNSNDDIASATVKYSDNWQYLKEVFEIDVKFRLNGDSVELIEEQVVSDMIKSRLVGKYVNVSDNGTKGYESYIIFNEDFSYTLHENNFSGFEELSEYYTITDSILTLKNRDLALKGYSNNNEKYEFVIDSLEQITCNSDIISTRKGNIFKKVEE